MSKDYMKEINLLESLHSYEASVIESLISLNKSLLTSYKIIHTCRAIKITHIEAMDKLDNCRQALRQTEQPLEIENDINKLEKKNYIISKKIDILKSHHPSWLTYDQITYLFEDTHAYPYCDPLNTSLDIPMPDKNDDPYAIAHSIEYEGKFSFSYLNPEN